jgi:hypothetical protein
MLFCIVLIGTFRNVTVNSRANDGIAQRRAAPAISDRYINWVGLLFALISPK